MSVPSVTPQLLQVAVVGFGYVFLLSTSGWLVNRVLDWAADEEKRRADGAGATDAPAAQHPESDRPGADAAGSGVVSPQDRDVGTIVGKAENILLLSFILVGAYTALAVIFAAKGLVRREDIEKNTLYYLAGTMTNVTYSVVVGIAVRVLIGLLGLGQLTF